MIRAKDRNRRHSQDKMSLKQLYLSSINRHSSPRLSGLWDPGSICSQRNSVGREKLKNNVSNSNINRKMNSRGNSHRMRNSTGVLTGVNSGYATCTVTPKKNRPQSKKNRSVQMPKPNLRSEYKFIYQIGFGGFGKVWKVQQKKKLHK